MRFGNLIKLKSWQFNPDEYGSKFKSLDNNIVAVELKKAEVRKDIHVYNSVKISLNNLFEKKYFEIPKCKELQITYNTKGTYSISMTIEEDMNIYNYYYILPPSKGWTTKKIKISEMKNGGKKNAVLNLKKITGFIFNLTFLPTDINLGYLYIKKFIITGYEVISLDKSKYSGYTNFLLKKNLFNNLKAISLNKKQANKKVDIDSNPLYCIYPFYQYKINTEYLTVCCDIMIDENVDFKNNKNLLNVWWSDRFDKIREGIKNLSYSECDLKKCIEYNALRESFMNLETIKKKYPDIANYIEGKTEKFRGLPYYITCGFDNTCNLNCRSCDVSITIKQSKDICQKYIQQIEDMGKHIERILISAYGDPFASPVYKEWLYNFNDKKFPKLKRIEIMTNAILWTEESWNKISGNIKKYDIDAIISIDGAAKETYEYNRGGAKFETLIKNLKFISNLRKNNEIKSLTLCFVIQRNNYKEIPLIIDFAKKYSFDCVSFTPITNWRTYTKKEFQEINIFDKKHLEYKNFKKIYKETKKNNSGSFRLDFRFKL